MTAFAELLTRHAPYTDGPNRLLCHECRFWGFERHRQPRRHWDARTPGSSPHGPHSGQETPSEIDREASR